MYKIVLLAIMFITFGGFTAVKQIRDEHGLVLSVIFFLVLLLTGVFWWSQNLDFLTTHSAILNRFGSGLIAELEAIVSSPEPSIPAQRRPASSGVDSYIPPGASVADKNQVLTKFVIDYFDTFGIVNDSDIDTLKQFYRSGISFVKYDNNWKRIRDILDIKKHYIGIWPERKSVVRQSSLEFNSGQNYYEINGIVDYTLSNPSRHSYSTGSMKFLFQLDHYEPLEQAGIQIPGQGLRIAAERTAIIH